MHFWKHTTSKKKLLYVYSQIFSLKRLIVSVADYVVDITHLNFRQF